MGQKHEGKPIYMCECERDWERWTNSGRTCEKCGRYFPRDGQ